MRYAALGLIFSSFLTIQNSFADCTRDQAFNKMMELSKQSTQIQMSLPDPIKEPARYNREQERFKDFATKLSSGGSILAAGKYDEACKLYDGLAKDFNVSPSNGKTLTMERLEKDAGRSPGGGCDITEAARKMSELTEAFKKAADAGKFPYERSREFSQASSKIGIIMSEDPSQACLMMDQAFKDFQLR